MDTKEKVTLKTIARDLGITHTTVSNAYNRPEKLSLTLRKKILDYAEQIGFNGPDSVGRNLRTGKTNAIGVIFNDSLSYAFSDSHDIKLMQGIAESCEDNNVNIVLIPLKQNSSTKQNALNVSVDGFILNATHNNDELIKKAIAKGLPLVTTDFAIPNHSSVSINNEASMESLCEHLISLGHTEFGLISFPSEQSRTGLYELSDRFEGDNNVMLTRLQGCLNSFKEKNIDIKNSYLFECEHNEAAGELAAKNLLEKNPNITAFICFSDRLANGAVNFCKKNNIKIPTEIAITGFDNITNQCFENILTTISQDPYLKGKIAADLLFKNEVKNIQLDHELIIRKTTELEQK